MFPQEVELHLFFTVNGLGATSPVQVNTQVFVAPHRLHLLSPHGNCVKLWPDLPKTYHHPLHHVCELVTTAPSQMVEKSWVNYVFCAGVGTKIDPTLCRADRMVGQVLGAVGALPEIFTELEISYFLLRRLLGVRTEGDKKAAKVSNALWEREQRCVSFSDFGINSLTVFLTCRFRNCPRTRCWW